MRIRTHWLKVDSFLTCKGLPTERELWQWATTTYTDSHEFWEIMSVTGATDKHIMDTLRDEFGLGGGSGGPGYPQTHYKGGRQPWIMFREDEYPGRDRTYKGKELVAKVREAWDIPQPIIAN